MRKTIYLSLLLFSATGRADLILSSQLDQPEHVADTGVFDSDGVFLLDNAADDAFVSSGVNDNLFLDLGVDNAREIASVTPSGIITLQSGIVCEDVLRALARQYDTDTDSIVFHGPAPASIIESKKTGAAKTDFSDAATRNIILACSGIFGLILGAILNQVYLNRGL